MVTAQRPWSQRLADTITPLNVVVTAALLVGGIQLSHLLVARTFGLTLVIVAMLATIPLALVLIVNLRFGVLLIFMFSMVIIEIKRAAWYLEVGLIMEFLQGALAIGIALSIITRRDLWRLSSPLTVVALLYFFFQTMISFHPNLPSVYNVLYALRDVVNAAVPFFAALYLVRDRKNLRLFLYLWLGTAVLLALYGLKQHYLGLNNWETAWLSISLTHVIYNQVRIFSTLGSADALGMHMAVSIVLALGMAFHTQITRVRYASIAMIPLFVTANLYTLTRGTYLAILVGVLALAIITRKKGLLAILVVAGIIVVGWYQINQDSLLANRVMTMFSPEQDESYTVRENYIEQYSPLIWSNPLGFGPATSGRQGGVLLAAGGLDPSLVQSLAGIPTDNYYFRIALENGWIGLLVFLGLMITIFWKGALIYFRSKDPLLKWVAACFLASYAAMAVASVSNNYFSHVDLKLYFWFSLGVLANLPLIERTQETETVAEGAAQIAQPRGRRRW